jgi:hypothetical protein
MVSVSACSVVSIFALMLAGAVSLSNSAITGVYRDIFLRHLPFSYLDSSYNFPGMK